MFSGKTAFMAVAVFFATVLAGGQFALAKDSGEQQSGGDSRLILEEVVVTATKREESLTEVPISIAVFGAESMRQTGVRQLKEVAEFIPNVQISSGNDFNSTVSIRGVGSRSRNIGFDARVGVYLDGVYLGQSPALNQELLELERVEVLRGPQGTLFGKNTVAGAINLISKKPQDELFGSAGVEIGNFNSRQYSGSINIPLSDNVYFKVSANQQERDGYITNLLNGDELDEQDAFSARAQLRVLFSDTFEANLSVDTLQSDRFTNISEPVSDVLGIFLNSDSPEKYEVSLDVSPTEDRDISGAALTLDWDIGNDYAIKSITGYRDTEINIFSDTDRSALDVVLIDYTDSYETLSQELQLISPEGDFQYVAGLYYYDQDAFTSRLPAVGLHAAPLFGAALGLPPALAGFLFSPGVLATIGDLKTTSYAAFFNSSYRFSDDWRLDFGFRYSEEDKEVDWSVDSRGVAPGFAIGNGTVVDKRTDTDFSPMVSLNYSLGDSMNLYAKYSSGYKSGGYNLDFITQNQFDAGIEFDKETVDAYEIGLKGEFPQQGIRFAASAFLASYDDYQVQQFIDLGGGATAISIRNAAKVDTSGLELEISWLPTESLLLSASVGLLDAEFDEFPGGGTGGSDVSGNRLPGAADYSVNLSGQYNRPMSFLNSELVVRLDYSYLDGFFTDNNNVKTRTLLAGDTVEWGYVENITRLNGRIGLESADGSWSAYIWGRNLTDETSRIGTGRDFLGTLTHSYPIPRTYGIDLVYNF
jgi:iron complex outermembrane receptor protein